MSILSRVFEPRGRHLSAGGTWTLLAPFLLLLLVIFIYPLGSLLSLSVLEPKPSLHNYVRAASNPVYARVLLRTIGIAIQVSLYCLVLSLPVAVVMARSRGLKAAVILACVVLPFWSSVLVRTAAWAVLLQRHGVLNEVLQALGLIKTPLQLLYTNGAVVVAMVHVLLPFMVLPVYGAIRGIPRDYGRAAAILGATPVRSFWEVTLPLAMPGIATGFLLVFLTSLGYFITPTLLGSPRQEMISSLISDQIETLLDWPFAAALVGLLILVVAAIAIAFGRLVRFDRLMGAAR